MNACDLQGGHFARLGATCACGEVGFGVPPNPSVSDATRAPRVEREDNDA